LDEIAGDVQDPPLHLNVAVPNELTRCLAAAGETHPVDHVVKPTLERGQEVVTGDPRERCDPLEGVAELLLAHTVDTLDLLLLTELLRVFRRLLPTSCVLTMLPRREWATLHRALLGV